MKFLVCLAFLLATAYATIITPPVNYGYSGLGYGYTGGLGYGLNSGYYGLGLSNINYARPAVHYGSSHYVMPSVRSYSSPIVSSYGLGYGLGGGMWYK